MTVRIDGTNTSAAPGITGADTDTGIKFGTNEVDIVTGGTDRVSIGSSGDITIADGNLVVAAGHGIDFSADPHQSGLAGGELLDDYERGTWTPAAGTGTTDTTSNARYLKVGNLVLLTGHVRFNDITTNSHAFISNLPFASAEKATGAVFSRHTDASKIPNACYHNGNNGNTQLYFYVSGGGTNGYVTVKHSNLVQTNHSFFFGITYQTND